MKSPINIGFMILLPAFKCAISAKDVSVFWRNVALKKFLGIISYFWVVNCKFDGKVHVIEDRGMI